MSHAIRFVLVNTSHPGNIGAAARAIRTMGFDRLVLVAPKHYPHPDVVALAAGADDVLEKAVVVPDLMAAIGDCQVVFGCTARRRGVPLPEYSPREAAAQLLTAAASAEVALVFGNERVGLDNDELKLCHGAVRIPSAADFGSLNLAQAVQVLAYELRIASLGEPKAGGSAAREAAATLVQLEHFFNHLAQTLDDIEFHKGRSSDTILQRLRRLFLRADMDEREVRILRGILDDAQRMARLAKGK